MRKNTWESLIIYIYWSVPCTIIILPIICFQDSNLCDFFFIFFFQNKTVQLDFDYFVQLFEQFYLSDDPSDLGNFINGKLDYNDKSESGKDDSHEEDEDPGLEHHKIDSNASLDSMDSDLNVKKKKGSSEDSIWLHAACIKYLRERCDEPFECCCAIS